MWKSSCFVILFHFISLISYAQTDTLVWREGLQLQAEDFKSKSPDPNLNISYSFDYQLIPASLYRWRPIFRAAANFDRTSSSIGESTTKDELQYAQLIFDIYGLHVRRLSVKIMDMGLLNGHVLSVKDQLSDILRQEDAALKSQLDLFMKDIRVATNNQEKPDRVFEEWKQKIRSGLEQYPIVKLEERSADWGVGIYVGAGRTAFSGKTKQQFSNPTSFQLGLLFDLKKRSRFGMDIQLGSNRNTRDFSHKGDWPEGLRTSWTGINFTYGFKIPLSSSLLLVPFTGLGINEFTPRKSEKGDTRRIAGYSPVVGLEFNHFWADFKTDPRENMRLYYKCRFAYNPSNFVRGIAAPQLNLSLSIGFDAQQIRTRMVAVRKNNP